MNGAMKLNVRRIGSFASLVGFAPLKLTRKLDVRFTISGFVELAGIAGIVWGFHLIAPFLGFIIGGIGLILLGLAIDPPVSRTTNSEQ